MSHDDFAFEPIRGLPENLPAGETILWQGAPRWQALARRAFHTGAVGAYFLLLAAWFGLSSYADGLSATAVAGSALSLAVPAAAAIGVLALLAWANARSTVYTITNRRVVLRYGVALPMTVNIPFRVIDKADILRHANGTGDIALSLSGTDKIAYLHLWPHVRPWHVNRPQPTLRAIAEVSHTAKLLATALTEYAGTPVETAADERPRAAAPRTPGRTNPSNDRIDAVAAV